MKYILLTLLTLLYPILTSSLPLTPTNDLTGIEFWPAVEPEWHCGTTETSPRHEDVRLAISSFEGLPATVSVEGTRCAGVVTAGEAVVEVCVDGGVRVPRFTLLRVVEGVAGRCGVWFGGVERVEGWVDFGTGTRVGVRLG